MAIFGAAWDAAVAIFVVLVLAEYVKMRAKISKQFNWIAAGGLFAILAGASSWIAVAGSTVVAGASTLFSVIAWILVLVGVLWGALELTKAR